MIHVGPDGVEHEFPDDAPPEAVAEAMRRHYAAKPQPSLPARLGRAVIAGGKQGLESIPATASALWNMPGQVASDVKNLVTDPGATLKEFGSRAARFAPPAVGMALGGAVGGFPGMVAGGTLGSLGVQAYDKRMAPTAEDIVRETTATAISGRAGEILPRAVKGTVKAALGPRSAIPGVTHGGAPFFHEVTEPRVNLLAEEFRPTDVAIKQAYADFDALGNPPVPTSNLQAQAAKIIAQEQQATPELQRPGLIDSLTEMSKDAQGGWNLKNVVANIRRMGAKVGSTPDNPKGMARLDASEKANLLKAMHEDVRTLGSPYDEAMAKADRLFRRSMAADDLQGLVDKGKNTVSKQYDRVGINEILRGIKRQELEAARGMRKAKLFVESFDPGELKDMKDTLRDIARDLPPIGAAPGVPVGSSQRALAGAAGLVVGSVLGKPEGWSVATGMIAPELISHALTTRPGRFALRTAFKLDPTATSPVFQNTLAAVLRSEAQPDYLDPALRPQPQPLPAPVPQPTPQQLEAAKPQQRDDQVDAVGR